MKSQPHYQNDMNKSLLPQKNPRYDEYIGITQFLKISLFAYEFNTLRTLESYDKKCITNVHQLIKDAPGMKPIQYIFTYYLLRNGLIPAFVIALLYPLPYTLVFYYLPAIARFEQWSKIALIMIVAAGMRASLIAMLLKHSLHLPTSKFHWVVFVMTIIIGYIFQNNYAYILLFLISIFLSYYLTQENQRDTSQIKKSQKPIENKSEKGEIVEQQQTIVTFVDDVPQTFPQFAILLLIGSMLLLWIFARFYDHKELIIFQQLIPIGLLNDSKETMVFYPSILEKYEPSNQTSLAGTLLGLSFIFPGPHIKPFFIPPYQMHYLFIAYALIYMPSILLICIYLGYRQMFQSQFYQSIKQSIHAVGNGLIINFIFQLLSRQDCNVKVVSYSAIVIVCIAKLYRLRQIFAVFLGVFLVCSRGIVLYFYKRNPLEDFVCFPHNN